jgi:nicotinate-nucleotide pyrophosphorylase (carboxylating)
MTDSVQIANIVRRALEEDTGRGDVTSTWTLPPDLVGRGMFLSKAAGILAGLEVARQVFFQVSTDVSLIMLLSDGDAIASGNLIAIVEGPMAAILTAERTALNFMQRMSGIATTTRRFVEAVAGTKAVILDTRKTVPGLRLLDKWAVRLGGGQNHRMRLDDMVLIKDNHIAAAGSITAAVEGVRAHNDQQLPIEVEVKTWAELEEAVSLLPDRIMLDNMSPEKMLRAVEYVDGRVPLEASGGVTIESVRAIAETGVDYISVGALTHSVTALDISLEVEQANVDQ